MNLFILFITCFIAGSRGQIIAGGREVSISDYPFAAALLYSSGSGDYEYACGGSIISPTAILSAASCFYTKETIHNPEWWQVRVGSSTAISGGSLHQITQIIVHDDFNVTTRDNDLAVLRTDSLIVLEPGVVELAKIAGSSFTFQNNQRIVAIGWGSTTDSGASGQLNQVQTFVIDQEVCAFRYDEIGFNVTENMVCVGWLDVGVHGQCSEGGAGSALMEDDVVVGIHSWTEGCATLRYPNINTQLSGYWRWIVSVATP